MHDKPRLLRITTASISLKLLLKGQFTFFQQQGFEVLTVSAEGPEVKELMSEGVQHQIVPMTRMITPIQDAICLWQLIRVIRTFKPHIVHTHTPKAGLLGMMAAWVCRVPVRLHTVAGLPLMEATGLKRAVLKWTERITYASAHQVYPNSRGLLEFMVKEFHLANSRVQGNKGTLPNNESSAMEKIKYKIIGKGSSNGIDIRHFSPTPELLEAAKRIRKQYQVPDDAVVFSFVGRVVKDKGIVELVEAFRKLVASAEARLILVGPYEQELDPLPHDVIHYIQNDPQVIAAGFQRDVRPWLLASEVFVFPSYREGFPNVVMQATCLQLPSIVSDINGCNEIIEDQVSGLIVPSKNAKALYDAMQLMTQHKPLRTSYAIKAQEFVRTNFDQQFVWHELLKEYKSLIATPATNE